MHIPNPIFMVFLYEPTAPVGDIRYFGLSCNSKFVEYSADDAFQMNDAVITYEVASLVDANFSSWANFRVPVIDVDLALTLASGRPRVEAGPVAPFSFLDYLKLKDDPALEAFLAYCFQGDRSASQIELLASTRCAAIHLQELWYGLVVALREKGEFERLLKIEIPVSRIMNRRQALGIRVNQESMQEKISELAAKAAKARRNLRSEFLILDPHDRSQVQKAFLDDPYLSGIVQENESDWSLQSILKLYSPKSALAQTLREYRDADRSKTILLRFGAIESGCIHPDSRAMGTVTGRIVIRNPALQNIASEYREVIIADRNMSLLYPDFKQCEPGILAHDSNDANLISDYNAGDLYLALSRTLFGDDAHRGPSKLLFLFVCYGMADERVSRIGSDITGLSQVEVEHALKAFFGRYPGIETWRAKLRDLISVEGRVGTPCGNFRYFSPTVNRSAALRGAQSQRIQGTAALILKKIIIDLEHQLPEIEILLPMHDALLVQVPSNQADQLKGAIELVFCSAYQKYCPSILPKVSFGKFASNQD